MLAVAGVPGGSFSSLFGSMGLPRRLRAPAGHLSSRMLPVVGPLLPMVARSLHPWQYLLSLAAMHPVVDAARLGTLTTVLREFGRHDWGWFRHLAVAVAGHAPLDVSSLRVPVTFLAGRHDSLVDVADMRTAARSVPGSRYRELIGTHFLPLQYPETMLAELRLLAGVPSRIW